MDKLYAFWKSDVPPYLLGGEVEEVREDGYVTVVGYTGYKFRPVLITPLEKGIKLQKGLNRAKAKYKKAVDAANEELHNVVKEITQPAERTVMQAKVRKYVMESIQRMEVFSDIEICTERDLDRGYGQIEARLARMSDTELEEMCSRIDFEDEYDSYYEILG